MRFLAQPEWVLLNGQPVDFIGAFALMDDKLRAELQTELAPLFDAGVYERLCGGASCEVRGGF
jgi:hypothetical protein